MSPSPNRNQISFVFRVFRNPRASRKITVLRQKISAHVFCFHETFLEKFLMVSEMGFKTKTKKKRIKNSFNLFQKVVIVSSFTELLELKTERRSVSETLALIV